MEFVRIRAIRPEGRFRAGRFWPAEGAVVENGEFDEGARAALAADPYLRVEPVAAGESAADAVEAAKEAIVAAIAGLPPEAFGADGKPKLDALRAALPDLKVSAALRDDVWSEVKVSAG